jgi:hypothetical protein
LALRTGTTMTGAVVAALRERLAREERKARSSDDFVREVMAIADHCSSLRVLDNRSAEEILYDNLGLPA